MRVIDLLKEKPYMFKWKNNTYKLVGEDYIRIEDNWKPYFYLEQLNDEVEVIEEEPRDIEVCGSLVTRSEYNRLAGIKEDKKIEKLDHKDFTNRFGAEEITDVKLVNKINEIIDKVNKGE